MYFNLKFSMTNIMLLLSMPLCDPEVMSFTSSIILGRLQESIELTRWINVVFYKIIKYVVAGQCF